MVDFITNAKGNPFSTQLLIRALEKSYRTFSQEQDREDLSSFTPLIEALFMVMRGHNGKLLDSTEPNKPACAQGLYVGLLSVLGEVSGNRLLSAAATKKMEVSDCTGENGVLDNLSS